MSRAVRTSLGIVVSLVLLGTGAVAHASANSANQNTSSGRRSRFSKLAFWRHHNDRNKTRTHAVKTHRNKNEEHHSRLAKLEFWRHKGRDKNVQTVQAKPVQPRPAQVKAPTKPAPTKLASGTKSPRQHAVSQPAHKKGSAPSKTKPHEKAQDHTTAMLRQ